MEPTKSQLIYKNACLSEGIEKLQIENEELRVQNEALELKVKNIKEAMGDLDFYYKEKLAEKEKERHEEWKTGKEWKWEWQKVNYKLEKADQSKIDYAVEQLERAKEIIDIYVNNLDDGIDCMWAIDQLITEIKEGK